SGGPAERLDLARDGEALERRRLDLAYALARDPEPASDLLERLWLLGVKAVAEAEHRLLPFREALQRLVKRRLGQADLDFLLDASLRDADEIADRGVVVVTEGLVQARDRA